MEPITNNMQKYENYRKQKGRLKKALAQGFYLEAICIEYNIFEDRLESAIRHSGKWKDPKPGKNPPSLQKKKNTITKMMEEKNSLARKYFTEEFLSSIITWKNDRNDLIHQLMKQSLHTEELKVFAERGNELVKELSRIVNNYNKALACKSIQHRQNPSS